MCAICGCGAARADGPGHSRSHSHDHTPSRGHDASGATADAHDHHAIDGTIVFGGALSAMNSADPGRARAIRVERDLLSSNDAFASANRARLRNAGTFTLNLVSSPGSGKTSLLVRAIEDLKPRYAIAVIEGDQQTSRDADRIRATGVPAVQVNTGKGCHLDAHMIGHALDHLSPSAGSLLFIENVGNLVCPAAFDLGENHKVVMLSVTEGEDKPLKYPDMFAASDLMLLNKSDLLPHLDFDMDACLTAARRVNPRIAILVVSARTGEGLPAFYAWIAARANAAYGPSRSSSARD
jgi:hydrogenase nickel incorporation protein HypB